MEIFHIRKGVLHNEDSVTIRLIHPDTNESLVSAEGFVEIDLYSRNSDIYRTVVKEIGRSDATRNRYSNPPISDKEYNAKITNYFWKKITKEVRNMEYKGVKVTPENIHEVLCDPDLKWINDQIEGAYL